ATWLPCRRTPTGNGVRPSSGETIIGENSAMTILAVSGKRILALGTLAVVGWAVSQRGQSAVVAKLGANLTAPASPASSQVKVVDLVPASLSGETNQDSEPFLAIQTDNPQVMVASAFTPNPFS